MRGQPDDHSAYETLLDRHAATDPSPNPNHPCSVDVALTSPPYFNLELYDDAPSQVRVKMRVGVRVGVRVRVSCATTRPCR